MSHETPQAPDWLPPRPAGVASARGVVVLTIAGHDPSSGAGITADLQTFAAHGLFGLSAITALTAQSTLGVAAIESISPAFLRRTLDHLTADLPPAGIKIGMLGSAESAAAVCDCLQAYLASLPSNQHIPIVFDPVIQSSSGRELYPHSDLALLHERLLPLVSWITPNWAELAALAQRPVATPAQAEAAAQALGRRHPHLHLVATAGGHSPPTDLLRVPTGELREFLGEHIETRSTHGTGCAFSSALLSRLVLGDAPAAAVHAAKHFVTEALRRAPDLGHGHGPLNLLWPIHL